MNWISKTEENMDKSIKDILAECDNAFIAMQQCVAYDGSKCAPNDEDFLKVALARDSIRDYMQMEFDI